MARKFMMRSVLFTWLIGTNFVVLADSLTVAPGGLTITQALSQATAGTIVTVSPGTYTKETGETFPLVLPKGVTLMGDENTKGKDIVIKGGDIFLSPTIAGQNVAILGSENSKISGLTIINPNKRGYGIWIEGKNTQVVANTLTGSGNDGIMITGDSQAQVFGNYFYKNSSNGITTMTTAKPMIKGNIFVETGFALNIDGQTAPIIEENIIRNCVDGAVVVKDSQPIFRGNTFEGNKRSGISVIGNSRPDLGTQENPGGNVFLKNLGSNINNARISKELLVAYGNKYDKVKNRGNVQVDAKPTLVSSPLQPSVVTPAAGKGKFIVYVTASRTGKLNTKLLKSLAPKAVQRIYKGNAVWQVGVFSTVKNAQKLLTTLEKKDFAAIIVYG
jgi:parallel beta-helix repeat protein